MRLWLERAPFLELLPNPAHGRHTKAQELRNFTGALIPLVEVDDSLARQQGYRSHVKTHPATHSPPRASYIIYGIALALDGKTIRDHLGCIVSLVEHEDGVPVALIAAPNKGHELPAAQKLLRSEAVNLLDCVVTADPLHCQTETAQIITQEKGGDYVLGVKDNQPTVRHNAQKKLAGATPLLPRPSPTGAASKPAL